MKKHARLILAVVFFLVAFHGLGAQEAAEPAVQPQPLVDESTLELVETTPQGIEAPSTSLLPYVLRMIVVLVFVIAAIYGLYALIKRSTRPKEEEEAFIRVLTSTPIAAGKSLHVVALGEQAWLLASTDASVSVVSELRDKELIDTLNIKAAASPQAVREDFISALRRFLAKNAKAGDSASGRADYLARQRDRLRKM